MDSNWLKERIEAAKALIEAMEAGYLAVATGAQRRYTLDTGQTRLMIERQNLNELQAAIDAQYNFIATTEARLYGAAAQVRPVW